MSQPSETAREWSNGLFAEAERQLNICNACRYCEGYCAVFPALERRTILSPGDITALANLCHDCRACLYACMYAPPHEFAVDVPKVLSALRRRTYDSTVEPPAATGRRGQLSPGAEVGLAFVATLGLVVALAVVSEGASGLWDARHGAASPYAVISYPVILVVMGLPFLWAAFALGRAGARYWHLTRGRLGDLWNRAAWVAALGDAAQLRYLKGGGADCQYPQDRPSPARRRLHAAVAYGFVGCLVATIAAGIEQDIAGTRPPYPWLSVPVITGTLGGAGIILGSLGLIALKTRTQAETIDPVMRTRDYKLLFSLLILAVTGLATLSTRTLTIYGPVLVIHLAAVAVAFAVTPYTKFCHVLYRLLALVQDHLERQEA